jgi:hypothetical protein
MDSNPVPLRAYSIQVPLKPHKHTPDLVGLTQLGKCIVQRPVLELQQG